jgi:COMPASS (Complex proteins associated with Set1p) component N/SET domain
LIQSELKSILIKDLRERLVNRRLKDIAYERTKKPTDKQETSVGEDKSQVVHASGLKGLTFKKKRRQVDQADEGKLKKRTRSGSLESKIGVTIPRDKREREENEDEAIDVQKGSKRRKISRATVSDDEEEIHIKRESTVELPAGSPYPSSEATPLASRSPTYAPSTSESPIPPPTPVQETRLAPELPNKAKPQLKRKQKIKTEPPIIREPSPEPIPEIDFVELGLDPEALDEEIYYLKLAISAPLPMPVDEVAFDLDSNPSTNPTPFRIHFSGSARTEGYYKIPHEAKTAFVAQYQGTGTSEGADVRAGKRLAPSSAPNETSKGGSAKAANTAATPAASDSAVRSSRSNRANNRRLALGIEEQNQLNLALSLSMGDESASGDLTALKFNQLNSRRKSLKFDRSPIHSWGLYALERIPKGDLVIEYVGEVIRSQVAEKREKQYERQGIGSSYLFRIDDDSVVDATMRGNLG